MIITPAFSSRHPRDINAESYCVAKLGGSGSTACLSLAPLDHALRPALLALHTFQQEMVDVGNQVREQDVARTKYRWWREEITRTADGKPRHPVTRLLAPPMSANRITATELLAALDEAESGIAHIRHPDAESLLAHCRAAGWLHRLAATRFLGPDDDTTQKYGETLSIGLRLAAIVAELGADVRRDRLRIPQEELHDFGVAESDVLAGRHTPAYTELMRFQVERAARLLDQAVVQLPREQRRAQRPGLILAALERARLAEIQRDGYRVLIHRLALPPLRKRWIAWKTRFGDH